MAIKTKYKELYSIIENMIDKENYTISEVAKNLNIPHKLAQSIYYRETSRKVEKRYKNNIKNMPGNLIGDEDMKAIENLKNIIKN